VGCWGPRNLYMWCFSNSADLINFRPLRPCCEVFLAASVLCVAPLPVEVSLKLISAVHAKRLTHCFKVMGAVNQCTFQGEEAAGCRAAVYFTGCAI
jgi:hypothetical protein